MPDLHGDAGVTLEYGDVDRLVKWLLAMANHAETVTAWDLLGGAAESIFYLDHWDCWRVQAARGWRRLEPVPLGPPEQPRNLLSFLGSTASQPARAYLPAHIIDDIATATIAT